MIICLQVSVSCQRAWKGATKQFPALLHRYQSAQSSLSSGRIWLFISPNGQEIPLCISTTCTSCIWTQGCCHISNISTHIRSVSSYRTRWLQWLTFESLVQIIIGLRTRSMTALYRGLQEKVRSVSHNISNHKRIQSQRNRSDELTTGEFKNSFCSAHLSFWDRVACSMFLGRSVDVKHQRL